jgi:hypothetical protein
MTRLARIGLAITLVVGGLLFVEKWRGARALGVWQWTSAGGEPITIERLWPAGSAQAARFAERLSAIAQSQETNLSKYAGLMSSAIVPVDGAHALRGSQQPQSPVRTTDQPLPSWTELDTAVEQGKEALASLRELMRDPPSAPLSNLRQIMSSNVIPSFAHVRISAQILHLAALDDLHQGNLDRAIDNLAALLAFARLYRDEPTLVSCMIRNAVLGLSTDICWDALQADDASDAQLSKLEHQCLDVDQLRSQLCRALEFERAGRLFQMRQFRISSYREWVRKNEPIYKSFGCQLPACDGSPTVQFWRQWVFHPAWRLAWADQEASYYLTFMDCELAAVREAGSSWIQVKHNLKATRGSYRPPPWAWRFYGGLPLIDNISDVISSRVAPPNACPFPDYSRACFVTLKNLTWHEIARCAIAIRRYQLKHCRLPPTLECLVPEYVAKVPCDLMVAQPLNYRCTEENSYLLYSVGEDGEDNGGDGTPCASAYGSASIYTGRDWVWPRLAESLRE